jgi:NADPH-dependent 2,4-dienoyl-CoA reductase/sulfur reductase-like enzyme
LRKINRRQFNMALGAGIASLAIPFHIGAQARPKVVVIGGGAGGASAARAIAGKGDIDVTLITASDTYTTCFFSNLYLGGFRDFGSITHGYDKLATGGVNVVTGFATGVDLGGRTVSLQDGSSVPYDRLIVAPGIDLKYDSVPGYSEAAAEVAPHAWQAGAQTELLKAKMDAMQNGDNIVMVPPPNPYRCPPGPYERVSMMAHTLKQRGFDKSKIFVIDPKPKFSKQGLFQEGWEKHYPGMVEWYGPDVHGGIVNVNAEAGIVETDLDEFSGAVLNVVPGQMAGSIASAAGLTNDTGFCPIDAGSMRSTVDENVFVIGDASIAGAMPKSGFSANSQSKVAANTIVADLTDSEAGPANYSNTCWSLIATEDGVKVGAQYEAVDGKIASTSKFISATGEDAELRKNTYLESLGWYAGITADMFG